MARTRLLSPEWVNDEALADCSFAARLVWRDLYCIADRKGRLEDRPRQIRAKVLPFDNAVDMDAILVELDQVGRIVRYEVDGLRFIQIVGFLETQTPHIREKDSNIPAIPKSPGSAGARSGQASTEHETSRPVSVSVPDPVSDSVSVANQDQDPRADARPSRSTGPRSNGSVVDVLSNLKAACKDYRERHPNKANTVDESEYLKTVAGRILRVEYDSRDIQKIQDAVTGEQNRRSA